MAENTMNNIPLQDHLRALMDGVSAKFREVAESQKETDKKFQELAESQKETAEQMKETDRQLKLLSQEAAESRREATESRRETDRQMKETNRRFGDLSNRFGELAEHLVVPGIKERFNALGFNFTDSTENTRIGGTSRNYAAEVDILLESLNTVMAVEVKSKPTEEDVTKHISRMDVLRRRADDRKDTRTYFGAIAGAIMSQKVRDCIVQNGFYAIEQSGDTMMINVPDNFKPRQW
ncbi:MAG: hypothetical protein FWB82_05045 [Treponema sp.]|nr:hypothetical protein [Treponema sp.]